MGCSSSEGMNEASFAWSKAHDAERKIEALKKVVDSQADDLCVLRQLVLVLIEYHGVLQRDNSIWQLVGRLKSRVEQHAAFDRSEGR